MNKNEIHKQIQLADQETERLQALQLRVAIDLETVQARRGALARLVASAGEEPQSVTERAARFVESQDQPVGTPEVVRHLRAEGVAFKEGSIAMLLSRHVTAGRLRKAGRGKYSGIR